MKLQLFYPVNPWKLNQPYGVPNPALYSQFGFTCHNGVDVAHGSDKLVRAPFNGIIVRMGYQPNGGGIFLGIISKEKYDFPDGKRCQVLIDSLHHASNLVKEGQEVPVGSVLAIQGNTGLSTGPHTHFQFRRVDWDGANFTVLDKNDANGSFDPTPYWTGVYAQNYETTRQTLIKYVSYLQAYLEKLKYAQANKA